MDPVNPSPIDTVAPRETLDAFVDGALSPEAAARVVLHLADCPTDQSYVDAVMETNALLAAAYAEPLHAPLPERLRAAIFPDPASAARPASRAAGFRGWRPTLGAPRRTLWGAVAASGVLAIGLAIVLGPSRDAAQAPTAIAPGATPGATAELRAALEANPSGIVVATAAGPVITPMASFRGADGRPCRQYEVLDTAGGALTEGVACRATTGGWTSEIAVASRLAGPERRSGSYVPASGAGAEALEATLDRLGAGMALTPAEEQALIAAGWAD